METDKSMTRPVLRRPDDDNDGLVALPPVPLVRQRLRASVKDFAISQPGRRAGGPVEFPAPDHRREADDNDRRLGRRA